MPPRTSEDVLGAVTDEPVRAPAHPSADVRVPLRATHLTGRRGRVSRRGRVDRSTGSGHDGGRREREDERAKRIHDSPTLQMYRITDPATVTPWIKAAFG